MSTIQWIVTNTKLLITREQSNNISLRLDPAKCLTLALAGTPATFLERSEYTQLSPSEMANLKSCGVEVEANHYIHGLVQVQLRTTNRIPDLLLLKNYIEGEILSLISDREHSNNSTFNTLWNEYHKTRKQLTSILEPSAQGQERIIEILMGLKDILTQVGCLVMPVQLLLSIKHPQQFLDHIAPSIGLYVFSLIAVDKDAPQSIDSVCGSDP